MRKILNVFLFLVTVQVFVSSMPVFAETVQFDERGTARECITTTLNETIAVKVSGSTGSGCEFSVDVAAGGEWVKTKGFSGSPPYAWGSSAFYESDGDTLSLTCSQPSYELDKSGLPSYINVTKEEDIPGSGTTTPVGKRYFFSVGSQAQTGSSFNAPLKFTTNCDMSKKENGSERPMVPIEGWRSGDRCSAQPQIEINPRTKTSSFPITIGTSCLAPSPSPSPTPPPPVCGDACTTPADCQGIKDGCTLCVPKPGGGGNICQPPPPPACNSFCSDSKDCVGNKEGCVECVAGQCRVPPACNVACTKDGQCAGAKDGCTACVGGVCKIPPACNVACTTPADCQGAKDGCTSCLPSDSGTGNVCRPTPACNVACTKDGQCAGAKDGCTVCMGGVCKKPPSCGTACTTKAECAGAKDGCSECLEGTCTDYNDNMCKCDGMVADITYPSDSFKFEAFGKVEGANVKKAEIADVTFRLTRDNQVVAKSNPITPTVVENSANKLRVKAAWSTPPPPVVKGATYRVFADVRCKPKKIVADAGEAFSPNPNSQTIQANQPQSQLKPPIGLKLIADVLNNLASNSNDQIQSATTQATSRLLSMFSGSTVNAQTNNLQLRTLNFVKLLDTDNCRFVMFKFDETLF